jgi:hypothetical protein
MKGEIVLDNPVLIDGKTVRSFTYDANEITAELFMDAETQMLKRRMRGAAAAVEAKLDYGFQLCLGCAAVIAVNGGFTFEDLMRLKGADVSRVRDIGRNFILGQPEGEDGAEGSTEALSGGSYGITPEPSALPLQSCDGSD